MYKTRQSSNIVLYIATLLILLLTPLLAVDQNSATIYREASILINIHNGIKYVEYEIHDDSIIKTEEGDVLYSQKDGVTYVISGSNNFRDVFNKERLYRFEMEESVKNILSRYNLEAFEQVRHDFIRSKGKIKDADFTLSGPGRTLKHMPGKFTERFIPNRQLSHVIYFDYAHAGALIDLSIMNVSFPFGLDALRNVAWSNDGSRIAYSFLDDTDQSILAIVNIKDNKAILRQRIDKFPDDITWSPDSSYIAVLTSTRRLGLWPWELLAAIAGHPSYYKTFYLDIYDTAGHLVSSSKITSSFKSGMGKIVWQPLEAA